jgi:hypothetical protein
MMISSRRTTLLALFTIFVLFESHAQLSFDIEGNYVFSIPYNTVRIPSEGGTKIDLANDLDTDETFTYRLRASYTIKNRHVLSALFAPLTIKSSGVLEEDVVYDDGVFLAGQSLRATYKFNSYRFTYRYLFIRKENLKVGAGITGKIREANITLESDTDVADYPNVGVVPLVNFYAEWIPANGKLSVVVEGDALGTAQGRAEDIFAGVYYQATKSTQLKGGYRFLEGGADVEDNYNFSFINYVALGAIITIDP